MVYYLHGALGSVVGLADADGELVEKYEYDPYGRTYISAPNGPARPVSAYGNPFAWTGQRYDRAVRLYHFWARSYSPALGRWLQRDPLGYVDGVGLYEYVAGRATDLTDPFGLEGIIRIDQRREKCPDGGQPPATQPADFLIEHGWVVPEPKHNWVDCRDCHRDDPKDFDGVGDALLHGNDDLIQGGTDVMAVGSVVWGIGAAIHLVGAIVDPEPVTKTVIAGMVISDLGGIVAGVGGVVYLGGRIGDPGIGGGTSPGAGGAGGSSGSPGAGGTGGGSGSRPSGDDGPVDDLGLGRDYWKNWR